MGLKGGSSVPGAENGGPGLLGTQSDFWNGLVAFSVPGMILLYRKPIINATAAGSSSSR